jgi:heme-degrading monooxygenase HmoA
MPETDWIARWGNEPNGEVDMFSVLFEVHPKDEQWDAYLNYAKLLRPELEHIDGFVDNFRYRSLTRDGWILSLSNWRDEKALVRWRTQAIHHGVQEKGREQVFIDYHLRVGEITRDTRVPDGYVLHNQRTDETAVGVGTTVGIVDATVSAEWVKTNSPDAIAQFLGLPTGASDLVQWDVFDAVLTPGNVVLLTLWRDEVAAVAFERGLGISGDRRYRQIRIIRDYSMHDRREAPQYYPDVAPSK